VALAYISSFEKANVLDGSLQDELLLSKIRLSIVMELITADWVSFIGLQSALGVTTGNLSTHLQKLVKAGYVKEDKSFIGRKPSSKYRLTSKGKAALLSHVAALNERIASVERGRAQ
jgi:DNA-binding MarR family transcriptional regulator